LLFAGANIRCFFDSAKEKQKKIVFLQKSQSAENGYLPRKLVNCL